MAKKKRKKPKKKPVPLTEEEIRQKKEEQKRRWYKIKNERRRAKYVSAFTHLPFILGLEDGTEIEEYAVSMQRYTMDEAKEIIRTEYEKNPDDYSVSKGFVRHMAMTHKHLNYEKEVNWFLQADNDENYGYKKQPCPVYRFTPKDKKEV